MSASVRPVTLLISALGGEGGGVLTNWIVAAAESLGLPVQSTSIPGVAQRTGSTTYYVEMMRAPPVGGRRAIFALTPGIGDIDLFVASELLEASRAVAAGYVTPERTTVIASRHRHYVINEKVAMGDGRLSAERLAVTVGAHARSCGLVDMDALARRSGAMINAVMLGLIAGSGLLPIPAEAFERAIEEEGKGVDANLRGFRAGLAASRDEAPADKNGPSPAPPSWPVAAEIPPEVAAEISAEIAEPARAIAMEAIRRLAAYQDEAYARSYLDRLKQVCAAERAAGGDGAVARETARHLALRMAYDDVARVAALKLDRARLAAIRAARGAGDDTPLAIHEFLKPGIEELCALLPPRLGRGIIGFVERRGWRDRLSFGMKIQSRSVSGHLMLLALSRLKRLRRAGMRFADEQAFIEAWLADIRAACAKSPSLAREIAACAGLIKGYGETHRRGKASYGTIAARVIRPALEGALAPDTAADAVMNARVAALADPEGKALAACVAAIGEASRS